MESPVQRVFVLKETIELANDTILVAKDGTERAIEDTAAPIKDRYGNLMGVVLVFRDSSEKKEQQKKIEYLVNHDQLTGLYNKRFFEEELRRLDTKRNLPLSFVFADVNGLKTINDAFGHMAGDRLIENVAAILKGECRADDIIARIGGDEFVMLLPHTDWTASEQLVKRITDKIEENRNLEIRISVSFGWDTKVSETQSAWEVLKNSEDIMYKMKISDKSGKGSGFIKSILNTLHMKSPWDNDHSEKVSLLCEAMGKAYSLTENEIKELRMAGQLHDIGKITVDQVLLNKADKLSETEWAQIRQHPETGYRLLGTSVEFNNIAGYVLEHHEKWDGTGYPKGLKGQTANWKARIIAISDAYAAMTSERPHRKALSEEEAIIEIKKNAGTQFDPDIARVFVEKVLCVKW